MDGLVVWVSNHRADGFRVWAQNPGGGSKEERGGTWRNYKGYVEAKQICAGSEAVRSIEIRLYHNFALKYLGAQVKLCNKPINKMGLPPLSVTSWTFSFPHSSPPPRVRY